MSKYPWFPFFASDWLGSTNRAVMTLEEQGGYMNLLAPQWGSEQCGIPDNDKMLAALSELREAWFKGASSNLQPCFPAHPTIAGMVANPKLLNLWASREEQRRKSSEGGKKSAQLRAEAKGTSRVLEGDLDLGCENNSTKSQVTRTIPIATPTIIPKASAIPKAKPTGDTRKPSCRNYRFDDEDRAFAEEMRTAIESVVPNPKPCNLEKWAADIRIMREQDDRTTESLRAVFPWANRDEFWRLNILSPAKLRKQFDQLSAKMGAQPNGRPKNQSERTVEAANSWLQDKIDRGELTE